MDVKEEVICRLCLKIAEIGYEIIDEITLKMFEFIFLPVNLDISKDPIICKDCANVTAKCFNFKSTCINAEKHIFSMISDKILDENRAKLESKDIYKYGQDKKTIDDNFVCGFCWNHLNRSNFVLLETLMYDVTFAERLLVLMPEMDVDTKNLVICTSCKQDLECYIEFVGSCLDVEEKINKYIQNEGTSTYTQVKLGEVLRFTHTDYLELDCTQIPIIKQEKNAEDIGVGYSEVCDSEFIS